MKYYIKRLSSGVAQIAYDDSEDHDFIVDEIPSGSGALMVDDENNLYFDQQIFIKEPTDHEILMTLLGVNE